MMQLHDFADVASEGTWQLIAGPRKTALFRVRSASWVRDLQLDAGTALDLPVPPVDEATRLV